MKPADSRKFSLAIGSGFSQQEANRPDNPVSP